MDLESQRACLSLNFATGFCLFASACLSQGNWTDGFTGMCKYHASLTQECLGFVKRTLYLQILKTLVSEGIMSIFYFSDYHAWVRLHIRNMVGKGKYACCFHNTNYMTSADPKSLDYNRYAGGQVRSFVESLGEKILRFGFIHSFKS